MYCDAVDACGEYDEFGEAVFSFTTGDITLTLGGNGCEGLWVTHPTDSWYDGYYYRAEDWYGQDGGLYPHYTDGMDAHLYWLDYDGYGYWQFDTTDQTGAYPIQDIADGGWMYVDGEWYDVADQYDDFGYAEYEFTEGTVQMQIDDTCY